jgi:hypothetical protein
MARDPNSSRTSFFSYVMHSQYSARTSFTLSRIWEMSACADAPTGRPSGRRSRAEMTASALTLMEDRLYPPSKQINRGMLTPGSGRREREERGREGERDQYDNAAKTWGKENEVIFSPSFRVISCVVIQWKHCGDTLEDPRGSPFAESNPEATRISCGSNSRAIGRIISLNAAT